MPMAMAAMTVLKYMGKSSDDALEVADLSDITRLFSPDYFNGDGVVVAELSNEADVRQLIHEVLDTQGRDTRQKRRQWRDLGICCRILCAGASGAGLAILPAGASRSLIDPFAEKKRPWKTWVVLSITVIVVAALWYQGVFAGLLG